MAWRWSILRSMSTTLTCARNTTCGRRVGIVVAVRVLNELRSMNETDGKVPACALAKNPPHGIIGINYALMGQVVGELRATANAGLIVIGDPPRSV
jgi:hypothetical protein